MADYLSPQDLVNAKVDAKTLGEALNDEKVVKPRYGKSYDSFPLLVRKLLDNGGFRPFPNEQAIKDYVPTVTPSVAKDMSTYKLWLWDKGAWTDTGLSELDRANEFTATASSLDAKYQLRNLEQYSGSTTIPIVADKDNRVILGYNSTTEKIYGSGIVDPSLFNSLNLSSSTTTYPIIVDENNKIIFGYDAAADQLFGALKESTSSTSSDEDLPFNLSKKSSNYIISYGQSLSTGVGSNIVLSISQPFFNKTFGSGVRGNNGDFSTQKPLVEDNIKPTPDGETNAGETICSGSANYASLSAYVENGVLPRDHVIFSSTAGHGNYSIKQLKKGATWYENQFLGHLKGAKNLNKDIALHAVNWLQGEADSAGNQTTYYDELIQLQADIETDAKAITNQESPTLFFVYQHSTFIYKRPAVALALLDACKTSDKFYFIAPTYAFAPASDNIHLSAESYKLIGAYYGRAYKQAMHDKIKPRSIMPLGASINKNIVKVKFNVPHKPLILDTSNLAETTQYGFAVFDGATEISIDNIHVENGDEVILKLSRAASSTVTINYAIDYLANSLKLFKGASGNLRDSCTDTCEINNSTKNMYYICPHFSLTAISENI